MDRASAVVWTVAIGLLLVDGAFALTLTWNAGPHPATWTIEGTFPDHHGGRVGSNVSDQVVFTFRINTTLPWRRGQIQTLPIDVVAAPGSGVRLVEPATLSLQLQRWVYGVRTALAGDLRPLAAAGANRWTTSDGSMHLSPSFDLAGSSFFLAVRLNVTVEYQDGSRYGPVGWEPDERTPFFNILTDLAPWAVATLAAGGIGVAFIVVHWRRGRWPLIRVR